MSDYPVLLHAKEIKALVIGAGEVGLRKIETLLAQNVRNIKTIDKNISLAEFPYKENSYVQYQQKSYSLLDLEENNLIFIATDNAELNSEIAKDCKAKGLLCNVSTSSEEGSFTLPALLKKDNLLLTISSKGLSPALSRALKADIETFLDEGYCDLCAFLGRLRPRILELGLPTKENTSIFRAFVASPYKEILLAYFKDKNEINKKRLDIFVKNHFTQQVQLLIWDSLC